MSIRYALRSCMFNIFMNLLHTFHRLKYEAEGTFLLYGSTSMTYFQATPEACPLFFSRFYYYRLKYEAEGTSINLSNPYFIVS